MASCQFVCVRSDLCTYKPTPQFDKFFLSFKVGLHASIYGKSGTIYKLQVTAGFRGISQWFWNTWEDSKCTILFYIYSWVPDPALTRVVFWNVSKQWLQQYMHNPVCFHHGTEREGEVARPKLAHRHVRKALQGQQHEKIQLNVPTLSVFQFRDHLNNKKLYIKNSSSVL